MERMIPISTENIVSLLLGPGSQTEETASISATPSPSEAIEILQSAKEGVEVIRRMLLDLLRQHQVIPIEALGKPFDPALMYAVGRTPSTEVAENTVVEEVLRGYVLGERVLRLARVIVASTQS